MKPLLRNCLTLLSCRNLGLVAVCFALIGATPAFSQQTERHELEVKRNSYGLATFKIRVEGKVDVSEVVKLMTIDGSDRNEKDSVLLPQPNQLPNKFWPIPTLYKMDTPEFLLVEAKSVGMFINGEKASGDRRNPSIRPTGIPVQEGGRMGSLNEHQRNSVKAYDRVRFVSEFSFLAPPNDHRNGKIEFVICDALGRPQQNVEYKVRIN